jgi:hypothetical protein
MWYRALVKPCPISMLLSLLTECLAASICIYFEPQSKFLKYVRQSFTLEYRWLCQGRQCSGQSFSFSLALLGMLQTFQGHHFNFTVRLITSCITQYSKQVSPASKTIIIHLYISIKKKHKVILFTPLICFPLQFIGKSHENRETSNNWKLDCWISPDMGKYSPELYKYKIILHL